MKPAKSPDQPPELLDQVREKIRYKHHSLSTENTSLVQRGMSLNEIRISKQK